MISKMPPRILKIMIVINFHSGKGAIPLRRTLMV